MCRLLGVVAAHPLSVTRAAGSTALADFLSLTRIHGDGWGTASVARPGEGPEVEVSAGSAFDDDEFVDATTRREACASVVHLRWASSGLAVEPENSHPFLTGGVAFAHNGSLRPFELLDDLLDADIAADVRGTTDSERYFGLVRQHLRTTHDLSSATLAAVRQLRGVYPDSSLNALVLDGDRLVAVHASATARLPDEDRAEVSLADLPGEHLEDYFGLRWASPDGETVVIGSTGFGGLDWHPLPAESVTTVSLSDRVLHTVPLVAD